VSLATLDDLEQLCGPQDDAAAAQSALDQATTAIQMATGQTLIAMESRVLLDGEGADTLLLPELPVTDVATVRVEGIELDEYDFEWSATGILRLTGWCRHFPRRMQSVDVTYSHGFDPIPADLVLATAKIACRILAGGEVTGATIDGVPITHERVGAYSVSYNQGLSATESAVVDRYRVLWP
jgi:hypothetical protein